MDKNIKYILERLTCAELAVSHLADALSYLINSSTTPQEDEKFDKN